MSLEADKVILQTPTAQAAGTVVGNWVDLSGYRSGAFYMAVSAITGSITPTLHLSPDEVNVLNPLPLTEVNTIAALSAIGMSRSPVLGQALQVPYVRVSSVIATGPVTGSIFFIGKV